MFIYTSRNPSNHEESLTLKGYQRPTIFIYFAVFTPFKGPNFGTESFYSLANFVFLHTGQKAIKALDPAKLVSIVYLSRFSRKVVLKLMSWCQIYVYLLYIYLTGCGLYGVENLRSEKTGFYGVENLRSEKTGLYGGKY